jgi:hypothetical protein
MKREAVAATCRLLISTWTRRLSAGEELTVNAERTFLKSAEVNFPT